MSRRSAGPNPSSSRRDVDFRKTPILLVILIALATSIVEVVVMLIIATLPPSEARRLILWDSFLLVFLLTPLLYFLVYRPMTYQIRALIETKNQLQSEIAERKRAEDALRQSERDLHFLSSRLLLGQEKERERLSTKLHEELAQDLTGVSVRLRLIERMIEEDQSPLKDKCEENVSLIRQIIGNVRELSGELAPVEIKHGGLAVAVRALLDPIASDPRMAVRAQIDEIDQLVPPEAQMAVYRILQEAVANVESHALATRMSIFAEQRQGDIAITVEDNGTGFDKDQVLMTAPAERGLGLATMEERARMLGGTLTIWSHQGQGTRITIAIPSSQG